MSKFKSYADRVNELAQATFAEYKKAAAELERAEAKAKEYPKRTSGNVTPEYMARAARAEADLLDARGAIHTAKMNMNARSSDIAAIRQELAAALQDEFAARPDELDLATLELMKTGILSADEYARLLQAATNTTMQRVIRHYASQAAVDIAKKYGENDQRAREMRAVSFEYGDEIGNKLAQFDVLSDVFRRATNNPGMIDHWEELTGEITDGF